MCYANYIYIYIYTHILFIIYNIVIYVCVCIYIHIYNDLLRRLVAEDVLPGLLVRRGLAGLDLPVQHLGALGSCHLHK